LNFIPKIFTLSKIAKQAVLIVLAAKLLVFIIGYLVTYLNDGPAAPLTVSQQLFLRWDAPHYQSIAQNGYVSTGDEANFVVFFPLYPLLIRLMTFSLDYINLSAIIAANICSLIAFIYLYKLTKMEFNEGAALKAVLFLSVFPTAYFLSAPYTEGLFFATVIASFYYARRNSWALAGLLGFMASLTRIQGLLMLPVLLLEHVHQNGWKPKNIRPNIFFAAMPLCGFLVYLEINFLVTGNAFEFVGIQNSHFTEHFDPWAGLNTAYQWATTSSFPDNITIGGAAIASAVFGLVMIGVAAWKRLRPSYILYMFLSLGVACSVSWWISVPRYVMAMFPMFILMGAYSKNRAVNAVIVVFCLAWLCLFTVLFALGWWAF
jgi:Gpi18-like mannosyltransferase